MSDSCQQRRMMKDDVWKQYVFRLILLLYKNMEKDKVNEILSENQKSEISDLETDIKDYIQFWLKKRCAEFDLYGFIVNLEAKAESHYLGFYDIKFEHSDWRNKYFVFECKNLGNFKITTLNHSIDEYIKNKKKKKDSTEYEDGGMHRYFINKYAPDIDFGGMLGFKVGSLSECAASKIKEKIIETYSGKGTNGELIDEKIVNSSVCGNDFTFDTLHSRTDAIDGQKKPFTLHHIIFRFH